MSRNLYVANLSHQVDEAELARLFDGYGVLGVRVVDPLATADPHVSGLVEVDTEEHGQSAIAALDRMLYRGRVLSVGWAESANNCGRGEARMFESMNIPEEGEGDSSKEPRGPRRGDFGDRSGGFA